MRVLAGDIGATKTLLALVDVAPDRATVLFERRFESHAYRALAPMVRQFLAENPGAFDAAGFGVAGPVLGRTCHTTNLPWVLDADELSRELALGPTALVNDFVAVALGVLRLAPSDLVALNPATPEPRAPIAVLGAGTGLGQAFLVWNGSAYDVVASEGGHRDFAPRDDVEMGLWRWLRTRHAHVSGERVVSGIGLRNIYDYLRESHALPESAEIRAALDRGEDLGALIGEAAVARTDRLSVAAMELFVSAYGAEAGNLALTVIARGGVYLAGGITRKILPLLTDGRFRAAFVDKGRYASLAESIPVFAITHPTVGLIGAAVAGSMHAR